MKAPSRRPPHKEATRPVRLAYKFQTQVWWLGARFLQSMLGAVSAQLSDVATMLQLMVQRDAMQEQEQDDDPIDTE